jgi:hypothetical protein
MSGFDAPYWNALQVLAWVCLGNRALVTRCSDQCSNGTASGDRWYWAEQKVANEDGDLHSTLVETPSNLPTELTVVLHASMLDRASVIEVAKLEILHKLAEGSLSVTGKQKGNRVRQGIAALEWCDLGIDYDNKSAVDRVSRNEVYECLMFRRETVLRLWPDVLAVDQEQPTKEGQTADARDTERFAAPNGAAAKPADASSGDHANQRGGRRRALYRGALVEWMASQELRILNKMDVRAIAQAFKSYCEKDKPELVPRLPQRLRGMFKVIEGHIRHRETKAAEAKRRATKSH